MGVKDLWPILSPVCEKRSLWELENKIIAIDLSAWICDSQSLVKTSQVNMYLRNLFFRTSYLLLLGAKPVFVLDGKAPDLKAKTIKNRQKKTSYSEENPINLNKVVQRTRLKSLQKQCTELLSCLGVTYVKAPGEAEAYCAYLNNQGLVDGVISQDSDAFLYGAKKVYRNFQMAPKYTYDCYNMDDIERKLGLTRTKLIGYSILSGSDYNFGINKIGKERALKFLTTIPDEQLFQRFLQWKDESSLILSNHHQQIMTKELEIEMIIKEKALQDENFPNLDVIAEFTYDPDPLQLFYAWNKPQLNKFIILSEKKLMWDEGYSVKKMVPLLGRWHLENNGEQCNLKIVKIDPAHGKIGHYKVTWDLLNVITKERKDLVQIVYPQLVADLKERTNAKLRPKSRKRIRKKLNEDDKLEENVGAINNKMVSKTLINNLILNESYNNILDSNENNNDDLNLSNIIDNIINRPNSNPAIKHLNKLI